MSLAFCGTAYQVTSKKTLVLLKTYSCESPETSLELDALEDDPERPRGLSFKWASGLSHDRSPSFNECLEPEAVLKSLKWVAQGLEEDEDAFSDDIRGLIEICELAVARKGVVCFQHL